MEDSLLSPTTRRREIFSSRWIIFPCRMFSVSSFRGAHRSTGLFVQTMCLIDRHLQVFLAILSMYLCAYRVSIHPPGWLADWSNRASVRCLTYILVVPSYRTSRQYQSERRSAVCPSSLFLSLHADRPYLFYCFCPGG